MSAKTVRKSAKRATAKKAVAKVAHRDGTIRVELQAL
jgi:hypothetical protein